MPFTCVRTVAELGPDLVLAPERYRAAALQATKTDLVPLSALVTERGELVDPQRAEAAGAVILDTTHVKDGVLDLAAAQRSVPSSRSAKRVVRAGDLLVSRLRPYLRQVGFAHPALFAELAGRPLLVSSEFVVLRARDGSGRAEIELAFLLPVLLGATTQAMLAAGQEGGHHPRVPRETLLSVAVPRELLDRAAATSLAVAKALAAYYRASFTLDRTLRNA